MRDTFSELIEMLPDVLRDEVYTITGRNYDALNELRLRCGQVCIYKFHGKKQKSLKGRLTCDKYLLNECINKFTNYSYYAYEEELRNGYISIFGGHRAGICGRAVIDNGKITLLDEISSINIRHAREFIGISESFVMKYLCGREIFPSTLIVSPPGCGKTTFLRDIVRILSNDGYVIGVCDERSEITGMYQGTPSFDIGINTDVLDRCPKAEGMKMLLRSMSPDVIVTDEIGRSEDLVAIKDALNAGVGIVTTMHGNTEADLRRGVFMEIMENRLFSNIVFLTKQPKPCTIREILTLRQDGVVK